MIDLTITPPLRRETVRSYVYRMLYDNIMSLHLTPGTAMSEQEVADLLKTSRTPVREAIIHLGQDRLLDILPQRGTFVSRLHTQMIREARFMRIVLEEAVMKVSPGGSEKAASDSGTAEGNGRIGQQMGFFSG